MEGKVLKADDHHSHIHKVNAICEEIVALVEEVKTETEHYIMKHLEAEQERKKNEINIHK